MYPSPIQNLIELFSRFPGVGPRQAARFVFYLLKEPAEFRDLLSKQVMEISDMLLTCPRCGNIEAKRDEHAPICSICSNPKRDQKRIAVVEEVIDLQALERAKTHQGLYHVLTGAFSVKKDPQAYAEGIKKLLLRITEEKPEEIIIAISPTHDGDTTARHLERELAGLGAKVTRLARGLSRGVDIEYVDEETLREALAGRH